jgi:hypothetical protein
MSTRAEEFLDEWFQANIVERALSPRMTLTGLARRCVTAAKKYGVPIQGLEEVVGDLRQAIADELAVKRGADSSGAAGSYPLI